MFVTLNEAVKIIAQGKFLSIAADESLLSKLPKGNWIGGTTPYFITEEGGMLSKEKLYIDEINGAVECRIAVYDKDSLFEFTKDAYPNGYCLIVVPFASDIAVLYAKESPNESALYVTPTIGWITGFDLAAAAKAKVFDGVTGLSYEDKAIVLHVRVPDEKTAVLGIVNIFEADKTSPRIEFTEDTLTIRKCLVDGFEVDFAEYLTDNGIDTQLPLIADYNSVNVNVSIKAVAPGGVDLYAPVFTGKTYYFAAPVTDYSASFKKKITALTDGCPVFSCNCILNYLYGSLEGKTTPPFSGPVTFGEIAYQLLNQTLVYIQIV
jgi:hypothetical protein